MSLSLGNTIIKEMYLGNTKIGSAYLGNTLVYQSTPPAHKYNYYWLEIASLTSGTSAGTPVRISSLNINNNQIHYSNVREAQTYLWDDNTLSYCNIYVYNTDKFITTTSLSDDYVIQAGLRAGQEFYMAPPRYLRFGFTTPDIPTNISFTVRTYLQGLRDIVTTLYGSDDAYFSNAVQISQKCHLYNGSSQFDINWNVSDTGTLSTPYTLRFHFASSSYNPTTSGITWKSGSTWTQVSSSPNVWDYTHESSNWDDEFNGAFLNTNYCSIVAAGDMSGVTSMGNATYISSKVAGGTFGSGNPSNITSIQYVCKFDTSHVTNMEGFLFGGANLLALPNFDTSSCTRFWSAIDNCYLLSKVPNFNFSSATGTNTIRAMFSKCYSLRQVPDMSTVPASLQACQYCFQYCYSVFKGASTAYNYLVNTNAASNLTTYRGTFQGCGTKTTEGTADLANIGSGWK